MVLRPADLPTALAATLLLWVFHDPHTTLPRTTTLHCPVGCSGLNPCQPQFVHSIVWHLKRVTVALIALLQCPTRELRPGTERPGKEGRPRLGLRAALEQGMEETQRYRFGSETAFVCWKLTFVPWDCSVLQEPERKCDKKKKEVSVDTRWGISPKDRPSLLSTLIIS